MASNAFNLEGKVALVTGANTGLGQGIAVALAEAGADIAAAGIVEAAETGEKVRALGRRFLNLEANLISIDPVERLVKETVAGLGGLDILVNNAGLIRRADAVDFSERDWDDVMNVNIKSAFFMSQAAGRHFIAQGRGKIINIASMLSFQGGIRVPSYTASKSGIAGITRLLANEWGAKGVNINAIAPGSWPPTTPRSCARTKTATRRSWTASRPVVGASHPTSAARRCSWPRARRTTSTARSSPSMADGWRADARLRTGCRGSDVSREMSVPIRHRD